MKKVCLISLCALMLTGCKGASEVDYNGNFCNSEKFGIIEERNNGNYLIIYDKNTKVIYMVLNNTHYTCTVTPLYNADGSLETYDGK